MKKERITLCKSCHDIYYPDLKQPEGTAVYMATGICKRCNRRASVKSCIFEESEGSK
jgi:hypothetical protein